MKIIQLTGDMPPCCCGETSSGGICCGSQAKCKLTISAPGCSADGKTAETIARPRRPLVLASLDGPRRL